MDSFYNRWNAQPRDEIEIKMYEKEYKEALKLEKKNKKAKKIKEKEIKRNKRINQKIQDFYLRWSAQPVDEYFEAQMMYEQEYIKNIRKDKKPKDEYNLSKLFSDS